MKVNCLENGIFPEVSVSFTIRPCYHCEEPACIDACEHEAIFKRESDGIVVVDKDFCVACRECEDACPYGAPQFSDENEPEMQKCDFCLDRWQAGKKPVCVEACPTRALDAGPIEKIREKYGTAQEAEGFLYDAQIRPAIILRPKRTAVERETI